MLRMHWPIALLLVVAVAFSVWSFIGAADRAMWFFELMCGLIGVAVLAATYRRFRFSALTYVACAAFFVLLSFAARYTSADVPVFSWLKEHFHLARNYFDRLAHFFQGVVPALVARELLLRKTRLGRGGELTFLTVAVALAVSALYELLEMWWAVAFYADNAPQWLGMQGNIWDSQWDMTMALIGGLVVAFLLARLHDRSIAKVAALQGSPKPE